MEERGGGGKKSNHNHLFFPSHARKWCGHWCTYERIRQWPVTAIKYPWLTSVTIRDFSHTVRDFEPYIRDWSLAYSYIYVVRAYALRSAIKDLSKLFSNKIWDTKQRRNRNTDKANDGGRRMVHCLTILLNGEGSKEKKNDLYSDALPCYCV